MSTAGRVKEDAHRAIIRRVIRMPGDDAREALIELLNRTSLAAAQQIAVSARDAAAYWRRLAELPSADSSCCLRLAARSQAVADLMREYIDTDTSEAL